MDLFDYSIFLFAIVIEVALLYINYIARFKLGIKELNPIWRKFDLKRGKVKIFGFFLQPIIVMVMFVIIYFLPRDLLGVQGTYFYIGIFVGYLLFNFWYDFWALYNFKKVRYSNK